MPFDPAASAIANSPGLRTRVNILCADPDVAAFHAHAQTAKTSVNVDGQKVHANFRAGRMLSSFEHELDRAAGDEVAAETEYAKAQNTYLPRRRTFEAAFGQTNTMLYGVANTGNAGTLGRYGQFCLVIEVSPDNADGTYVIPCNSLGDAIRPTGYVDASNNLDETGLTNEIALLNDLAHVVTEERAGSAAAVATTQWPHIVCGGQHSLIEVLMVSERVTSVAEVRMRKRYVDVLDRADRKARRMGKTVSAEKHTLHELNGYRALIGAGKKVVTV